MSDPVAAGPPPVSVIVPVYNAGSFLRPSLDSLFAQTLRGIEVIAVDDCSTDGSLHLLVELESTGRLRLIRQPWNSGPSAARNAGLRAATGEFVGFVDADDTVFPTMYEDLYRTSRELGADIVSCAIQLVDGGGAVLATVPFPLTPGRVYSPPAMREELHHAFETRLPWYHWRNLYRRELLTGNGILFDEAIRKGEDSVFNLQAFALAHGCSAVATPHYSYRKHPSSATASPLASESVNLQRLGDAVIAFYETHGFDRRAYDDFHRHILRSDLPTAVMRLGGHAEAAREIRALLGTAVARGALATTRIGTLGVPRRVAAMLWLAKHGRVRALVAIARTADRVRRYRG